MFTVVLDACVMVPITLADTILRVSEAGGFGIRWSERILEEVERTIVSLGVAPEAAERRITRMRSAFPYADVGGLESLVPVMGNDPKDRHVLAAAVRSGCDTIVTFNLIDFPPSALEPWGVEAVHPDTFLLGQLELAPGVVMQALERQSAHYRSPLRSVGDILGTLGRTGLPGFADEAHRHLRRTP